MTSTDTRYEFSRCRHCGQRFQNIDFGCAAHHLMCPALAGAGDDARISEPAPKMREVYMDGGYCLVPAA